MKTFYFLFILFPISGFSQSSYSNPYTPPVKVEVTVRKNPYDFSSIGTNFANSYNQARQAAAANKAAEAQAELVRIENMKASTSANKQYEFFSKRPNLTYAYRDKKTNSRR